VEAHLVDGTVQPLRRLRYGGSARHWGFGLYLASSGRYEDQILPTGLPIGSPEEALDCAGDLYLNNPAGPSASPPKDFRNRPLSFGLTTVNRRAGLEARDAAGNTLAIASVAIAHGRIQRIWVIRTPGELAGWS
jgi:hypothetical protein